MLLDKQWCGLEAKDSVDAVSGIIEAGLGISDAVLIPEEIKEDWAVQIYQK